MCLNNYKVTFGKGAKNFLTLFINKIAGLVTWKCNTIRLHAYSQGILVDIAFQFYFAEIDPI